MVHITHKHWLKSLSSLFISIFLLTTAVFFIARLAPGDPLTAYYGDRVERLSTVERERAETKLGLNSPLYTQYYYWLKNVSHGDFGLSYKYKLPVSQVISERAINTILLGGGSFTILFLSSLSLGILLAYHQESFADKFCRQLGTIFSCIPEFWLALVLIFIFSVKLHLLPSSGAFSLGQAIDILDRLKHLLLPLSVIVIGHLWYYAYLVRNRLASELNESYVLMARAKGLNKWQTLRHHLLRNILPPYLSLMAASIPHILGGTYIVELVFAYPGIGTLAYESARYHDYNLLMLICILSGSLVIIANMLVSFINSQLDPRLNHFHQVT